MSDYFVSAAGKRAMRALITLLCGKFTTDTFRFAECRPVPPVGAVVARRQAAAAGAVVPGEASRTTDVGSIEPP
jgi:hypothetical protein